ncbi:efflux transporter periplasmic adaptor subunit [Pseudoalteromonas sp. NBT06-2]|uniref:efflux RND transporter periplasmic adaptor subunit n=1 Tax=Pseudoalteromonas sp. NBT06-2 TaxID=2025950 RepID=UPI000BA72C87|nr:efflux RND transporter periplasmic adaptor subunit [Pseudoalteromonas sp. NBT06-2]PAJ74176.1 efflux transporter periplasmic adaptor subunit [Pseudoalteromonas sp. NBT06-2]
MNLNIKLVLVASLTGVLTYGITSQFQSASVTNMGSHAEKNEPLYWVAPMDANYRRDKPGLSPMGMELVPFYADGASGSDSGLGTIKVSPYVVNNLGVRTGEAKTKQLHLEIKTVGYVKYDEDKLIHIHPRVEGWVEKLYIKALGDPVIKNEPIYSLYSPELVNAQEELLLAMGRKNTRLIRAAENRLAALQLPKSAITNIKKNQKVSQTIIFYAPQSGVVENLNIREGFFVKPGTKIMSIGALDEVWVEAEVFERQASQVKKGTAVTMTLDYLPGREWVGKVDYIYPTLDEKTRTVKVRLRFNNQDMMLKPNMFAQVVIHVKGSEALLIPTEALIRTGNQDRVVLALGEGQFKSVAVKVGRFDDKSVEVISGLIEGDKIVTSAQFLLDSESSKSSDFKRMYHNEQPSSVWVEASINSLMANHNMINVDHHAISDWDWPKMTMDFMVSPLVDFSSLAVDMMLHIEITKDEDGSFEITSVHIPELMTTKNNVMGAEEKIQVMPNSNVHNGH